MLCITALLLLTASHTKAQWIVSDPSNLAQGILNSANEIRQTSSTVTNVVKNFKEVEKYISRAKNTMIN